MSSRIIKKTESQNILDTIFSHPKLVAQIQQLPSLKLLQLINRVGLEDSSELILLASNEQIENIFDEDLWYIAEPGKDEKFKPKRFILWLETMQELGCRFVAEKLNAMDEDFLIMALSHYFWVFTTDDLYRLLSTSGNRYGLSDEDLIEKALSDSPTLELQDYLFVAKTSQDWDVITNLLVNLDREDHQLFEMISERCHTITLDIVEDNDGLYNVLYAKEQITDDVTFERQIRREKQGYLAPSNAKAFLELARTSSLSALIENKNVDPITKSYFANFETKNNQPLKNYKTSTSMQRIERLIESDFTNSKLSLSSESSLTTPNNNITINETMTAESYNVCNVISSISEFLEMCVSENPQLHEKLLSELSYLGNILLAGLSTARKPLRPSDAATQTMEICELGLNYLWNHSSKQTKETLINEQGLVKLFQIGWNLRSNHKV